MQKQRMTKTITGTYTVTLADCGYTIICNSASPFTVTIPSATGAYNFNAFIVNIGAGTVTCDSKLIYQNCFMILHNNGGTAWASEVADSYGNLITKGDLLSADTNITITGGTDKIFDSDATITLSRNPTLTSVQFDISATPPAHEEGLVHWNDDEKCLEFGEPNGGSLQIGQEQRLRAKNDQGATIYNGQAVYISGASGSNILVKLADADSYFESIRAIAVATEDIGSGQIGRFTTFGFVRELNTSAYAEGDILFLSATPGMMSATPPAYPSNRVAIGTVTRSSTTQGEIGVKITYVPRKFGDIDNGNYSGFEDDGTLVFNGNATVYNDFPPNPIIRSRLAAANNPTLTTFVGNIEQYTFAVNDYIYDNFELMHDYKEGTDLDIHLHWATNGVDTTNRYVKWEVEYSIANRTNGTSNSFASSTVISNEFMIPANTTTRTHYSGAIGTISGTGLKIGAIVTYRLRRITSTGTAPTNNPFGLQAGMHHVLDTCGSRTITGK